MGRALSAQPGDAPGPLSSSVGSSRLARLRSGSPRYFLALPSDLGGLPESILTPVLEVGEQSSQRSFDTEREAFKHQGTRFPWPCQRG